MIDKNRYLKILKNSYFDTEKVPMENSQSDHSIAE